MLVLGITHTDIVESLTWARSTIGIVVDPEVCLRAEANFAKIAAHGFLQYELPMRFKVSGCTSLGETIGSSIVVVEGFDWRSSAAGRGVDAVGYGTRRRGVNGTADESSVVHGSCHCVFEAEENSQCCIKHGGSREKHRCEIEYLVAKRRDCAVVGRRGNGVEKARLEGFRCSCK